MLPSIDMPAPGAGMIPDMLVVGLYGAKGPSADLGGIGCSDIEYQSQMSLWCIMAAPLIATNNIRAMNEATKKYCSTPKRLPSTRIRQAYREAHQKRQHLGTAPETPAERGYGAGDFE